MQVKKDGFGSTQTQQFTGNPANILLLGNFMIREINTQQASIDQTVKVGVRQTFNTKLRLPVKET
jgi:hypothetical protein